MALDWAFTDKIPGSFTKTNAEAYYAIAERVLGEVERPVFLEVGVDQGRSLSVILQAIRDAKSDAFVILVDSWESVLAENKFRVRSLINTFSIRHVIFHMTSMEASHVIRNASLNMLLIDANHTGEYPGQDCEAWLPKLKRGGFACFHDVDSGFEAVDTALKHWTSDYEDLGTHEGLAIRQKL